MSSFNKVILMGNLTRDPELRVTGGGMSVGTFTLAINNRVRGNDEKEDVSFIDCVAFGKQADFVKEYLGKGMPILLEGRLQQNRWEQEGQKRSKIEVIAQTLTFVGPPKRSSGSASDSSYRQESYPDPGGDLITGQGESDIPF
ncbi:MAG: single-stranded DNA-binding protein [Nitrospirae bacterium]|nr:single-stranded DNA-binding protein [Nitrospirota bacterium]MCL5286229.1 single-stranded DNA-binding protein [Nitrospirota bacterium]